MSCALPPGPRAPKLIQALSYTYRFPSFIGACRERFGERFTLRIPSFPPGVVTRDRRVIAELFTGDPLQRRHGNDLLETFIGSRSLMLLEPAAHLHRRKLELAPFHGERIAAYDDRVRELVEREVGAWAAGERVESHPRFQAVTLAVILELVFGVTDPVMAGKLGAILHSLNGPQTNLAMFTPRWLSRRSRWNLLSRGPWQRFDRLDALLREQITLTRTAPNLAERDDVLALLVRARDERGQGLTDEDLRDELLTLVTAGHETTAAAIAWGADLLARNPEAASRLRESSAAGERDYVRALAKEVLRTRTVVPVAAGRHLLDGLEIGACSIPPEVTVLVDADGVHHDPELYPDPDTFRPERFLDAKPEPYSFLPFGGGAHRCLGAALAMIELERGLEALARCGLEPLGPSPRPVRRALTMVPPHRGPVRVTAAMAS